MNAFDLSEDILTEANRQSIILVDFQPTYENASGYDDPIEWAMEYINQHPDVQVAAFFNGEDVGVEDTKEEVAWHYIEHGLDEDRLRNIRFREKTYAFLRDWMDEGISDKTIIRTVRYMVMNRVNDTRDIEEEVLHQLLSETEWEDFGESVLDGDLMMTIPDIDLADLKRLSGSLIGGGGKHECLKELQLLMNAFNIKYKMVDKWIYGG